MQTLGPYQLYQRLGLGATAEVFLATGPNPRGTDLLAVKLMLQSLADWRSSKESFLREARTSALLRHPNIVEIYEVGEVASRPFIAMELVRGWSLSLLLKKMKEAGDTFAIDEACEIVRQAALGLHYIHEVHGPQGQALGLIHRDVSPQNLIISEEGGVKVVDFGLAKATANATHTTGLKGKIRYMAPEQLKDEALDRRIDVFALGAILWEMVCDQPLHPGPSEPEIIQQAFFNEQPHPDEVKRGLPRAVVEVLQGAVARDKNKRIANAAALAQVLTPLAGVDVNSRIAAHLQRHFERLPRSKAELEGQVGAARAPGARGVGLLIPPGKVTRLGDGPAEVTEPTVRPDDLVARARALAFESSNGTQTLRAGEHEASPSGATAIAESRSGAVETLPIGGAAQVTTQGSRDKTQTMVVGGQVGNRGLIWSVGVLVGVSLMVGGFALARQLFPTRPMVVELPPRERPKWKSDLTDEPELAIQAPPPAVEKPSAKALANRPPRKGGKGKVRFVTTEPAEVFIGKKRYGLSNEALTLPSGRHHVEVVVPGGEKSAAIEVDVIAGTSSELKVTLEK